ncbi:MAG TPA: RNA polymerase sigma factor [Bacteroidales bacterium]|nr:RNA polymerase sigma factor [Bacteroidales bacterium]
MTQKELLDIIDECLTGNTGKFRLIVKAYQKMLYALSFRLLCDEEEAKDICQETFIKLWENLKSYNPKYNMSTWLYRICSNLCLDRMKKTQKSVSVETLSVKIKEISDENSQLKVLENEDVILLIEGLSSKLTPKQKLVFTLHYFDDLTTAEISEITGLSANKIKSNIYLARKKMIEMINKIENYERR